MFPRICEKQLLFLELKDIVRHFDFDFWITSDFIRFGELYLYKNSKS